MIKGCACGIEQLHYHDPKDPGAIYFVEEVDLSDGESELLFEAQIRRQKKKLPN